jgi:hypothetical protein
MRILALISFSILYLAMIFPRPIVGWLAPEFESSHGLILDRQQTRDGILISNLYSDHGISSNEEMIVKVLEPSIIFHEYSLRGTVLRFLLTPASPLEVGSLWETQTWKKWFGISATWLGISKTMFICFYFIILFKTIFGSKSEISQEEDLEEVALRMMLIYGLVGGFVLPLVSYLLTSGAESNCAYFEIPAFVLGFVIGWIVCLVEFLAVDLFGTLLRICALPALLLHSLLCHLLAFFFT